jgi:hypothetical protein
VRHVAHDSRRPTCPDRGTNDQMPHVQLGQRWRDRGAPGGPIVITVDQVDGATVQGASTPETASVVMAVWVGSVTDFDGFQQLPPGPDGGD